MSFPPDAEMIDERFAGTLRERRRVQTHTGHAERAARRGVGPGDTLARVNRLLLLDELRRYRKAGRLRSPKRCRYLR